MQSATDLAASAIEKDSKKLQKKKSASAPTDNGTSEDEDENEDHDGVHPSVGAVNNSNAGGIENDDDILASLGL